MMTKARNGTVQKVVRVPFGPPKRGLPSNDLHGYGILRDGDGRDIFFDDSAVCHTDFANLERGLEVLYTREAGPLARATRVWIPSEPLHA